MSAAKEALHVSTLPPSVSCRENEQKTIVDFCKGCIKHEKAGSLYICGCPGTGKSLSMEKVKELLLHWTQEVSFPFFTAWWCCGYIYYPCLCIGSQEPPFIILDKKVWYTLAQLSQVTHLPLRVGTCFIDDENVSVLPKRNLMLFVLIFPWKLLINYSLHKVRVS